MVYFFTMPHMLCHRAGVSLQRLEVTRRHRFAREQRTRLEPVVGVPVPILHVLLLRLHDVDVSEERLCAHQGWLLPKRERPYDGSGGESVERLNFSRGAPDVPRQLFHRSLVVRRG